jgi:hypothetical protein
VVHAAGLAAALRFGSWSRGDVPSSGLGIAWLLIRLAWWLIVLHALEITVWAMFYLWNGNMPDAETAFYFSGTTYTTIGYGDVVLDGEWRMLAPIQGLTGILMCGLSTGYFFAVVMRLHTARAQKDGAS